MNKIDATQRFWDKVNKTTECWLWQGSIDSWGYGRFWFNSKLWGAHRYSYYLEYGNIPEGMLVCHHCDNPACARPSHLFLGKDLDNCHDKIVKGRMAIPYGSKNGNAMFTEKEIISIKNRYNNGGKVFDLYKELKERVSYSNLEDICYNQSWKHVGIGKINSGVAGERNPNAKLTQYEVINIRHRYNSGETVKNIHRIYNDLELSYIYRVCKGITWKNIQVVN